MSVPYSALIDTSTFALLALSQQPYIISLLAKSRPLEAEQAHGVNWPNYRTNFTLVDGPAHTYPSWTWHSDTRRFRPIAEALLTDELRQRSALAVMKCAALGEIAYEMSCARYPVWRGLILQETVYLAKKLQAQRFKDLGYPELELLHYPYVLQYADFSGLTPREAADEILFKAQLDDDLLLKTEGLRLEYFKRVTDAVQAEALKPILDQFREEIYRREIYYRTEI